MAHSSSQEATKTNGSHPTANQISTERILHHGFYHPERENRSAEFRTFLINDWDRQKRAITANEEKKIRGLRLIMELGVEIIFLNGVMDYGRAEAVTLNDKVRFAFLMLWDVRRSGLWLW